MDFKTIFRTNAILLGLGAMLLFTQPVRAQQDMDPASFDEGAGTVPMAQPDVVGGTSAQIASTEVSYDTAGATQSVEQVAAIEAGFKPWTPAVTWTIVSLVLCSGLIYLHALAEMKRELRFQPSRQISRSPLA